MHMEKRWKKKIKPNIELKAKQLFWYGTLSFASRSCQGISHQGEGFVPSFCVWVIIGLLWGCWMKVLWGWERPWGIFGNGLMVIFLIWVSLSDLFQFLYIPNGFMVCLKSQLYMYEFVLQLQKKNKKIKKIKNKNKLLICQIIKTQIFN